MLRVSAKTTETNIDLSAIRNPANPGESADLDSGIEFGAELAGFATAVAQRDHDAIVQTRQRLLEAAGPAALVDAAGVAANFQRMVRIADATGIPVDDMQSELGQQVREELALSDFPSAANSSIA